MPVRLSIRSRIVGRGLEGFILNMGFISVLFGVVQSNGILVVNCLQHEQSIAPDRPCSFSASAV